MKTPMALVSLSCSLQRGQVERRRRGGRGRCGHGWGRDDRGGRLRRCGNGPSCRLRRSRRGRTARPQCARAASQRAGRRCLRPPESELEPFRPVPVPRPFQVAASPVLRAPRQALASRVAARRRCGCETGGPAVRWVHPVATTSNSRIVEITSAHQCPISLGCKGSAREHRPRSESPAVTSSGVILASLPGPTCSRLTNNGLDADHPALHSTDRSRFHSPASRRRDEKLTFGLASRAGRLRRSDPGSRPRISRQRFGVEPGRSSGSARARRVTRRS